MSQTEKYYRKYRKYKNQYLYYKQYLGGMNENIEEEMRRQQEQQRAARQAQQVASQTQLATQAAAEGADDEGGVNTVIDGQKTVTDTDGKVVEEERKVAEEENTQQQQEHQDQAALETVQGLMMQKQGIDIQINSTLQEVQFDERMGQVFSQEIKGSLKNEQQSCQQLANQVKDGVKLVPMVRALAKTINTHERQENGQYTLSKRGDNIEKMVLKQVDRFATGDVELGKKIYADCKEEIHHEVGALINDDKVAKKLKVIREEEAQKNKTVDAHAVQADTRAATEQ